MANKYELGSSVYAIPVKAKEHYTKKELDKKIDMYSAIEYDSGKDPVEYSEEQEKGREITKKAARKILAFKERQKKLNEQLESAKKKDIGFKLINFFSRAA
jgi:uncharacterized protein (UPF0128 family)